MAASVGAVVAADAASVAAAVGSASAGVSVGVAEPSPLELLQAASSSVANTAATPISPRILELDNLLLRNRGGCGVMPVSVP